MSDPTLTDLLERAGDRTEVGPAPLEAMLHGVRRRRRRHAVLAGAALTAAAVATAILVPVPANPGHTPDRPEPDASPPVGPGPDPREIRLEGRWIVVALVGANGRSALLKHGPNHVRLTFHRHGSLTGFDGCNHATGSYVLSGDRLHVRNDLSQTLIGCFPGGEPPLFARLLDVRSVARDQGGTYLEDASDRVVIALIRRAH
jgi:hypothetical protein